MDMSHSESKFVEFMLRRVEELDKEIINDITPEEGWIGNVSVFDPDPYRSNYEDIFGRKKFNGHYFSHGGFDIHFEAMERINKMFPKIDWGPVSPDSEIGEPCDP